jgi:hypothetical protein
VEIIPWGNCGTIVKKINEEKNSMGKCGKQ